ncbi:MAG: contractile injection system tape measure protein, partial [Bacteroidota bacterium]
DYGSQQWLEGQIEWSQLIKTMSRLYPNQDRIFTEMNQLISVMATTRLFTKALRSSLIQMMMRSWSKRNWALLEPDHFWKELMTVLLITNYSIENAFEVIQGVSAQLPTRYRITLRRLMRKADSKTSNMPFGKQLVGDRMISTSPNIAIENPDAIEVGLFVPNAGLVLLNGFFKMLFERLNLLNIDEFVGDHEQMQAAHYLQYVAMGNSQGQEAEMILNKLLVGIPVGQPIISAPEISPSNIDIVEGMLSAAIGHWPAIGKSSHDGFRGNWFVREGVLYESDEYWNLTVEKRSYDILLNQSPFSFSIVKYPWMPKPLKVDWPY